MKKNIFLPHLLSVCLVFSLPFIGFFTARDSEKTVSPTADEQVYAENLLKSGSKFKEAMNARLSASGKQFMIKEVSRNGSTLTIRTEGACNAESLKIIWDGAIAESFPMQVHMALIHEETTGECEPSQNVSIQIDFYTLLGKQARLEDFHFMVHNGSAVQDVVLPGNAAVSN